MKQLATYQNGNTHVTLMEDGTKIREYEGAPLPVHPESIDVKITDYCDMGCSYCFLPDMEVMTVNGNKNISSLEVGDKIYSQDLNNNRSVLEKIDAVLTREIEEEIMVITLDDHKVIKCTTNHKIFTLNRGWVRADELTEDDELKEIF